MQFDSERRKPPDDAPIVWVLHLFSGESAYAGDRETFKTIVKAFGRDRAKDFPNGVRINVMEIDCMRGEQKTVQTICSDVR